MVSTLYVRTQRKLTVTSSLVKQFQHYSSLRLLFTYDTVLYESSLATETER